VPSRNSRTTGLILIAFFKEGVTNWNTRVGNEMGTSTKILM